MNIYQIDNQIAALLENAVDPETGEVKDITGELESLQMEKEDWVENIAKAVLNDDSDIAELNAVIKTLTDRRNKKIFHRDRLKSYVDIALAGVPFKRPTVECVYRKSQAVELDDGFIPWAKAENPELLRYKEPEPDKTAIKNILKDGGTLPHAALVTKQNLSIK
jgi:hypothetical protein